MQTPLRFATLVSVVALLALSPVSMALTLQPIPGLGYVGHGMNLQNGMPAGQVLENTFDYGYNWTNPFTQVTYLVPDTMEAVAKSKMEQSNTTQGFSSVVDYQVWAYHQYHWSSGFFGMDSHTRTTYSFLKHYYSNALSLATSHLDFEFLELVALLMPPAISPAFLAALNALPSACCDNATEFTYFQEFIDAYGHGLMDSATFGGRLTGQTWFPQCFINITSLSWVTEQSSWSFLGIIGGGHGSSSHEQQSDANFTDCISSTQAFYGGSFESLRPNQWAAWAPTVFDRPFPVKFHIMRFSDLFLDPPKQVMALEQAINKTLVDSQAHLNETEVNMSHIDPHISQCCASMAHKWHENGKNR